MEQLLLRLRKDLNLTIPVLSIETIRAKGYQIKGKRRDGNMHRTDRE